MKKIIQLVIPLILLVSLIAGCSQTDQQKIDQAVLNTMVAMNVQASQTALAANAISLATGTSEAFPTFTPTATANVTATPEDVWLTVNENTNCRTGAASNYPYVAVLMKGQKVKTTARNFEGNYYYVSIPDQNDAKCWVWSQYLTVEGNPTPLPVYTQLPTPTPSPTPTPVPSFAVYYEGLSECGGEYNIVLKVENTGGVAWSSFKVSISDKTDHHSSSYSANTFTEYDGCTVKSSQKDLAPDEEGIISNNNGDFSYDPSGHKISVSVTLYSKDGRSGTSYTQEISFVP